jgi:hypothetical protein
MRARILAVLALVPLLVLGLSGTAEAATSVGCGVGGYYSYVEITSNSNGTWVHWVVPSDEPGTTSLSIDPGGWMWTQSTATTMDRTTYSAYVFSLGQTYYFYHDIKNNMCWRTKTWW